MDLQDGLLGLYEQSELYVEIASSAMLWGATRNDSNTPVFAFWGKLRSK